MGFRQFIASTVFASALYALPAAAQIEVEQLGTASAYDADLLGAGELGLDSSLWQGTSAARAALLLDAIKPEPNQAAEQLTRAALYSGGVPPQADSVSDRETYIAAKLGALLRRGDLAAFDKLVEQMGLRRSAPAYHKLFVGRALLSGQTAEACTQADAQTAERKAPYWAKLRAFCHYTREENAAAELTMDLLKRSKHKDDGFYALLDYLLFPKKTNFAPNVAQSPLHMAMARHIANKQQISHKALPPLLQAGIALDTEQDMDTRLSAFMAGAHILSPEQTREILTSFAATPVTDVDALLTTKTWSAAQWGQAYNALQSSSDMGVRAAYAYAMLSRAEASGIFVPMANFLTQDISILPASLQASQDPMLFARIAVMNRDLGALRGLYEALPADDANKPRIALAADAIGGGFMLGELGVDIETRLGGKDAGQARAVRDTYIAVALGANLSDKAEQILTAAKDPKGAAIKPANLLALRTSAARGAKAETALRSAAIIGGTQISDLSADSFAALLFALREAGMHDFAGQLAAQDFLSIPTKK